MSAPGLSAAELIQRFKQGKPTSREERQQQRESVGKSRMWWEEDGGSDTARKSAETPGRSTTPLSARGGVRRDAALETIEEPRRPYLKPPMVQPSRRSVTESQELFRTDTNMGNSMDVDYLIEKEIRNLEKDIQKKERDTMKRLNMGSFTPHQGLNRSMENGLTVGTSFPSSNSRYRPTLRDQGGLLGIGGGRPEDLLGRSDVFRSSADTLGSTGMLGLLRSELKLDGKKDTKDGKDDDADTDGNDGGSKPKSSTKPPEDVQIDLDALMKNLREFMPEEKPSYLPEGVDETIPQITNRLHCQMMEFMSLYNGAMVREKEREDEQKKRDEQMKEEGRRLERERRLLELDIPPFQHPIDYVKDGDSTINAAGTTSKLGDYLRPGGEGNEGNKENVDSRVPPFAEEYRGRETPGDARFVSRLLDYEMQQVDMTYGRMRQVRQQLSGQLNHLNHVARDPHRYAYEQQFQHGGGHGGRPISGGRSHRMQYQEEVDDGHGYHPSSAMYGGGSGGGGGVDDGDFMDEPDFDPVKMQYDPQYRDRILSRRARRRQAWNPYPEILPENIFNTAKAVESMLNSAMDTLNRRLPEKRQPIPTGTSTVSPRPATPMPSAAQREAAMTPVPHATSSTPVPHAMSTTPVPTTPMSVSSHGSNSTQQSVTTATNTALNAGRSPAPVTATTPAIPTTSTAPNATVVKPIATNPTTTTIAAAKPSTTTTTTATTTTPTKPFPELKSDTSGHIERLVDSLVATAKEKVASGGTAPGTAPKPDVSVTSLDLSRDSNLSAASSISLSSSHERLIPNSAPTAAAAATAPVPAPAPASAKPVATAAAAPPAASSAPAPAPAPAPNTGLRASISTPVPSTPSNATRPRSTTPLPGGGHPIISTTASGTWTTAQMDFMHRDLEYVDNVLNQVDRAPGRFDKYTQPNIQYRPPPIAPTPAAPPAPNSTNKSVTFASSVASMSHDPHDHGPMSAGGTSASRGILVTPRNNTPTSAVASAPPVDPLQNQNPGITADLVDPLRELRQRAPHRVYENVLYRPGSMLHPPSVYGGSVGPGGMDPVFAGASAPALPLTIPPPSMNPQFYHAPPSYAPPSSQMMGGGGYSGATDVRSMVPSTNMLHPRPVEGAAFRMLHANTNMAIPSTTTQSLPHTTSFTSLAPSSPTLAWSTSMYSQGLQPASYQVPAGNVPMSSMLAPPTATASSTHDRERFLSQMKNLRQQMGGVR